MPIRLEETLNISVLNYYFFGFSTFLISIFILLKRGDEIATKSRKVAYPQSRVPVLSVPRLASLIMPAMSFAAKVGFPSVPATIRKKFLSKSKTPEREFFPRICQKYLNPFSPQKSPVQASDFSL